MPVDPRQQLQQAVTLHRQGNLAAAEALYRQLLASDPRHADALHLLGTIALQRGRADEAIRLIEQAIAAAPDRPHYHGNLAGAYRRADRIADALGSYDRALALRPDSPDLLNNRGIALQALGRHDEALASYDSAIALRPDYAAAFANRGRVLQDLGRHDQALASYDRAIALQPNDAGAFYDRGTALRALHRFADAVASCDRAIALRPDFAAAHCNRGNALHELGQPAEALASFDRAIALDPGYAEAHGNRGIALWALQRPEQAIASYDRALALKPDWSLAISNRAITLQDLGRHDEALASYDRAIALAPDNATAHFNKALCQLRLGYMPHGWAGFEWRWKTPHLAAGWRDFDQPLWLGHENLAGRTILLHSEQGFGDTLQFCRYAPLVAALGANVVLEVQRPLARLLASQGLGTVVAHGDALPPFDLHCPLMSLPLVFGTELATIPTPGTYLAAEPGAWQQRLAALSGRRVGLVWAGSSRRRTPELMTIDRRRSVTLAQLAPLAAVPGISFVSLQKNAPAAQTRSPPSSMRVHDWTDELHDFADTAALIAGLDLVISVDTAVAHLAGALGKPVWILNRYDACWRWMLDRIDTPWYESARLFRQPTAGDWDSVIAEVAAALSAN